MNPFIVRGLDYYTKTVFEIISGEIGAQGTVCGGGRYDGLVSQLGGQDICGIGFGMGMERLMMVMEAAGGGPAEGNRPDIFIATMGRNARLKCVDLLRSLREKGFSADMDHISRSMKAQFKYAGKINCRFVGSLGEDELEKGIVKLKNMDTGEEKEVAFDEIAGMLAK